MCGDVLPGCLFFFLFLLFSPRRRLPRVESGSGLAGQRRQPDLVAMGIHFMEQYWLDKYAVRSGYLLVALAKCTETLYLFAYE